MKYKDDRNHRVRVTERQTVAPARLDFSYRASLIFERVQYRYWKTKPIPTGRISDCCSKTLYKTRQVAVRILHARLDLLSESLELKPVETLQ